jgi:hypothetical protein
MNTTASATSKHKIVVTIALLQQSSTLGLRCNVTCCKTLLRRSSGDRCNGGPTSTHALGPFSPAIGTGSNPLNLASDQRGPGFSRVFSGFVDIGAFQTSDAIFANGLDPLS